MRFKLRIRAKAEIEILEAAKWYEDQLPGLSIDFLDAIEVKLQEIQKAPFLYQYRYQNIRMAHAGRFPYAIHFLVEGDTIIVLAVLHHKQDFDS